MVSSASESTSEPSSSVASMDLSAPPALSPPLSQVYRGTSPSCIIQCAKEDVSEEDMCLVEMKAHEVRTVAMSALFKKI
ncbi:hypothetical protein E2C01_065653 [Portunus trituberculatus]|uniref:Uncharacterized protein n=1 Tax=Portunus trituberculatus TaxID=210409 RepID=A0A5B7HN53_PORTR|nr:hypothetical protein [Portunus trituberculatus]